MRLQPLTQQFNSSAPAGLGDEQGDFSGPAFVVEDGLRSFAPPDSRGRLSPHETEDQQGFGTYVPGYFSPFRAWDSCDSGGRCFAAAAGNAWILRRIRRSSG